MPPGFERFDHEAMNTTFTLWLAGADALPLPGIARACFDLLDDLESHLSRYVDGSDVQQINAMRTGERLFIGEACHACLQLAAQVGMDSGGRFDVTLGTRIEHVKRGLDGPVPSLRGRLAVAPDRHVIVCEQAGRVVDLGGIGKGFALDRLMALLRDWEMPSALLSAGASTQLAFGERGWPAVLGAGPAGCRITLRDAALSASGTSIQGCHIATPAEDGETQYAFSRVWCVADSAVLADAWSTAAMLMTEGELRQVLVANSAIREFHVQDAGDGQEPVRRIPGK